MCGNFPQRRKCSRENLHRGPTPPSQPSVVQDQVPVTTMRNLKPDRGALRSASHEAVVPAPLERLEVRAVHEADVRGITRNLDFDDLAPLVLLQVPVVDIHLSPADLVVPTTRGTGCDIYPRELVARLRIDNVITFHFRVCEFMT